jgi:hypothetical protein
VSEADKDSFYYQVILWESRNWSWEVISWDIWKHTLRYWEDWQRYEISTFQL